jgi:ATP/maltotriose-dependent transcriptional regulator MalT
MIERPDLVERVLAAQPRIVRLTAPAGYGKSTLARALAQRFPTSAVCDCDGAGSVAEFCHRIIVALAREEPGRAETLAQRELSAGDDERAFVDVLLHA